jgi:hypothetical protein
MTGRECKTVSQRKFLRYVEETGASVRYAWPGGFRADGPQVKVPMEGDRLGTFLGKLDEVLPFKAYDKLSREVWVAHMKAADQADAASRLVCDSPDPEP